MFFLSCSTTKEVIIEYQIPEIDWPEFPKLPDYEITENGILVKDENYFRKLLIFKTKYKSTEDEYERIKKLYGGNENGNCSSSK